MMDSREILKLCAKAKNMSNKDVADRMYVAAQTYGQIVNGRTRLNETHIKRLCKIFEITPNQLLGFDPLPDIYMEAE